MVTDTRSTPPAAEAAPASSLRRSPLRAFVLANRAALGTLAVFVVMMLIFLIANPGVFTRPETYRSVAITLPVAIFLAVPLVFVVTAGEIDLAFPSVMGMASWAFAAAVVAGIEPFLAAVFAIAAGLVLGGLIGALVVYGNLSSLVATLGANFLLRGVINIFTEGRSIALTGVADTPFYRIFGATYLGVPVQILWALLFVAVCSVLYNRHRFGARVHCVGDNPDSAAEMGINVDRVRVQTFVFMGLGAALAGIFSVMINFVWWPTTGDGYLLPSLAAVFVGGTPTWGGIGTVAGGALGALIVAFINSGVLAAGFAGFWVNFFYGLIIILALLGHRFNQRRFR